MASLESVLASIPGYGGYLAKRQMNQQQEATELQQASGGTGLLATIQKQQQDAQMRQLMTETGGDPEKAMDVALRTNNIGAAHQLAPLVKMAQEKRMAQGTVEGLSALNEKYATPAATPAGPTQLGIDQPVAPAAEPAAARSPDSARLQRISYLKELSSMPKFANNPIVQQRMQAEIDKLETMKPLVEHNFSVGENQVQPHQSFDNGVTWQPIPGSKPSAKFAKMIPDDGPAVTDDTLAMDSWRYLTDGTLPPNMGRGAQGAAQATKIRNESSRLAKEMGMTPDEIRFQQLNNKTGVQAIGQLAKARAQILQFEKTANLNSDLALEASEKVDRTGVPVVNRWIQAGRTNIAGDVEAQKFHAATETFVAEYAKVMGGGYGAAATTEGAQQRAHTLLNTANTKEQFRGVVGQLKREMDNRVKALNSQMDEERQRLRSGTVRTPPVDTPASPAAAAPKVVDFGSLK